MAIADAEHGNDDALRRERIRKARASLPDEEELSDLAELFKVFGDLTRIRILFALFDTDICVRDLSETLDMTQSAVSHQLKILRAAGLVRSRREGRSIVYSLADEHVRLIIGTGRDHIEE